MVEAYGSNRPLQLISSHINSSKAVDYVEENTQRSTVAIVYVYCDYMDPRTQSEMELLHSVTRQLVEQCKLIPSEITVFRERMAEKMRLPTADERISFVKSITGLFDKVFIFIDALVNLSLSHP